jgi:hypothetical protein
MRLDSEPHVPADLLSKALVPIVQEALWFLGPVWAVVEKRKCCGFIGVSSFKPYSL